MFGYHRRRNLEETAEALFVTKRGELLASAGKDADILLGFDASRKPLPGKCVLRQVGTREECFVDAMGAGQCTNWRFEFLVENSVVVGGEAQRVRHERIDAGANIGELLKPVLLVRDDSPYERFKRAGGTDSEEHHFRGVEDSSPFVSKAEAVERKLHRSAQKPQQFVDPAIFHMWERQIP